MEIKNTLSESFDFIEESCGSGSPEFEFYAEPKMVSEGVEEGAPSYPIIGRASGVFAPIGVMSRNNRIYDNDHYDYLLENQQLVDRIAHRGMLGTIGHHDKKVDDQDLAEGKVSHIVTNLRIVEEADGSRNLYGILEILDTPAGHLLKTYYDSGVPLFVSSRGGGNLLPVPNESYKRVDKTKYFLETFDIVKNPGFLQAKPVYEKVSESVEEEVSEDIHTAIDKYAHPISQDRLHGKAIENSTKELEGAARRELGKENPSFDEVNNKMNEIAKKRGKSAVDVYIENKHNESEETKDKLDKLIESISNLVTAISEGDKKVVIEQQDDERKETNVTKEGEEAKKVDIVNTNKNKPEDEENDDSESAIASSVTEEEKKPKRSKEELAKFLREALDKDMDNPQGPKKPLTLAQRGAIATSSFLNRVNKKSIDVNEDNLDEADQVLAQPIVAVQNTGNSTKSAQEANPEVKEPVTMDRLELARALKAKVNNGKKVEV